MSAARRTAREWTLRVLLVVVLGALAWSLTYEGEPPKDVVHTHHAFRMYALGEYVEFPLFNYEVRHVNVHIEKDPLAGDRANEVIHVHKAGITLEDYLRSLGLDVSEGKVCLDDSRETQWAIHHGECYEDNASHEWRLFMSRIGTRPPDVWLRPGEPFAQEPFEFGTGQRLLLTYVPKAWSDAGPEIEAQRAAMLPDMSAWPQFRASEA